MKSYNIVFTAKEKVEFIEEEVSPPGPEEVLCKAEKSLLSTGTETLMLRGIADEGTYWSECISFPRYTGDEMAATVVAVGKGVKGFKEGDRVAGLAKHKQYCTFKTNTQNIHIIPDNISFEEACMTVLSLTAQLGVRRADLKLGESVGIVGLGMVGQLALQYVKASGAQRIVAIDTSEKRLEVAKAHGATHILKMNVKDCIEPIKEITGGKMLDVIIDATGSPYVLAPATRLLRKFGRAILVGDTTTPSLQCLGPRIVANSIAILGAHSDNHPAHYSVYSPWDNNAMTELYFDYLTRGIMEVKSLITHRYSPAEAPKVYEGLLKERSTQIGIIFDWNLL